MKKICFFIVITFLSINTCKAENLADAKSSIIMNYDTKEIIYKDNEMEKLPPASMTKMMTLLLVMEKIDDKSIKLDDDVTISSNASSMGGSQVYLNSGEVYKVEELLKSLAIASANDAAVALAEFTYGSVDNFVDKMNEKAKELGLINTFFKNPHGLDEEGHYSCSYDMALIARELLTHKDILKYTSTYEDYLQKKDGSSLWLVNTNKLVRFYNGVDGLKTGYTESALYCLTATAKKDNTRFITVIMGSPSSEKRNNDTKNMLDYAFNNYKTITKISKDTSLTKIKVLNSEKEEYDVYLKDDYKVLVKKNTKENELNYNIKLNDVKNSFKKEDNIGILQIDDKELPLVVHEDINKISFIKLFIKTLKMVTV